MKWYWKLLIVLGSFIAIVVVVNIGLNAWVKFQLPKIINRENDSAYFITYKNLDISLLNSTISAKEIVIVPKSSLKDTINKAGIYAKVKAVNVQNFKIWDLAFSDKLKARSITVEQPKVILYSRNDKENVRNSVVAPFEKIITVSDIYLNHGDLKIINVKNEKAVLSVHNINFNIDGILINEAVLKDKIPFKYKNYRLNCDSLYYHPNEFYHIKTKKLTSTKTDLSITKFEMLPSYSRPEHVAKMKTEKDIYTLACDSIKVGKIDWGFTDDDFFFHCNSVALEHTAANIYRSKEPADDLTKKHLYNKLLRELKFDLKVDTLKIRNSLLEYEEEKSSDFGAGKLTFNNFNVTATNIRSGFKKTALPDLKIRIDCRFMNASPFKVDWKLNVMDKTDGFNIKGTLTDFEADKIIPFAKPYLNVTTKGMIDKVQFNFTGNDKRNAGIFKVEYDNLKFTIYKKDDRKKKNKLLTFVANIFVKKDTKDKLKEATVEVGRIPEKSFYNLFWRSVEEGLKKILI
ncbi:hypothetical protein [Flavobacterium sp.]